MFTNIEELVCMPQHGKNPRDSGSCLVEVALTAWCRVGSRLCPLCFEALGRGACSLC